jgi:uncharacterized protein
MSSTQVALTLVIGALTGLSSGLLGIGGGALGTPLLRLLLGLSPYVALATPFPVMIPASLSGTLAHHNARNVDYRIVPFLLITALPMTWFGASLTAYISGQTLMVMTAVLLMVIGVSFIVRSVLLRETPEPDGKHHAHRVGLVITGAVGGFLAGLLAIGGGVVYVPILVRLFHRPMKVALATSLLTVLIVAIPGTIRHAMLDHIDWIAAALLSVSAIPASFLGAKLAHRLHGRILERIFGIWTISFGVYFLFSQL